MKKGKIIILCVLFITSLTNGIFYGHDQDTPYFSPNDKASIDELGKKIETVYRKLLKKLSEIKIETDQKIEYILSNQSTLKKQFAFSYEDLLGQILEVEKEINNAIEKIETQRIFLHKELHMLSTNQNTITKKLLSNSEELDAKIYFLRKSIVAMESNFVALRENNSEQMTLIRKYMHNKFLLIVLSVLFLGFLSFLVLFFSYRKLKRIAVVEDRLKLDAKISEILDNQLVLMKKEAIKESSQKANDEIDHSLPVKVGTEIYRMRKRIENMDEDIRGLHSLKNALTRLEDEFVRQGYSINDLTGQQYFDGLTVNVINVIEKTDLRPDIQVISRMITPQICYKGIVISHGEVELFVPSKDKI